MILPSEKLYMAHTGLFMSFSGSRRGFTSFASGMRHRASRKYAGFTGGNGENGESERWRQKNGVRAEKPSRQNHGRDRIMGKGCDHGCLVFKVSCRSYGAWRGGRVARYYKHSAPNGA